MKGTLQTRRFFLGSFGDPGHAFPMLALGTHLVQRGHTVMLETWERWRAAVEAAGMAFAAAPEYPVFPTREQPLKPYEAVVRSAPETRSALAPFAPDVVVHDVLTIAPALAGELEGVPVATLVPHLYPGPFPGLPPYALGARPARKAAGRALWRGLAGPLELGFRRGRSELNETRTRLGLPPVTRLLGGISDQLCMVGTFPQLEYPRSWPKNTSVVGPLLWEPPAEPVDPPAGTDPVVLVAPSTAHDPEQRLLRAALAGLAHEPVRVLAATNRRAPLPPLEVPLNAKLVDWLSYSRTMPGCALVITHAGHGTLARALACGCPVVAVPHSGDMGENAARADWAGAGVRLPWRFLSPATLRLAVRRALATPALSRRAAELQRWAEANDGATVAAALVEELATETRPRASARSR
jgi:MGT family glycosyltransferase